MTRAEYNTKMKQVDELMLKTIGMTHGCLADFMSWDAAEAGMTPLEIAEECLDAQDYVPEEVYELLHQGEEDDE